MHAGAGDGQEVWLRSNGGQLRHPLRQLAGAKQCSTWRRRFFWGGGGNAFSTLAWWRVGHSWLQVPFCRLWLAPAFHWLCGTARGGLTCELKSKPIPLFLHLRVVTQPALVQPGLQHAVLDEHEVCGMLAQCMGILTIINQNLGPGFFFFSAAQRTRCNLQHAGAAPSGRPAGDTAARQQFGGWKVEYTRHTPLRRSVGVASTTACRSSFRVQTIIGPGGPVTASPRRTITYNG